MFSANIDKILRMIDKESDSFENIAEVIMEKLNTNDKVLGIVGGGVNSVKLAYSFTRQGKRVLFIDADTDTDLFADKYKLGKSLQGYADVISKASEKESEKDSDVSCATNIENFNIIFTGDCRKLNHTVDEIGRIRGFIDQYADDYYFVAVLSDGDGIAASNCDASVLIIDKEQYGEISAEARVKELDENGCMVLGVIINE